MFSKPNGAERKLKSCSRAQSVLAIILVDKFLDKIKSISTAF